MGRKLSAQCSNGHFWTTTSTKWVRPKGGTAYRVCRYCIRARRLDPSARSPEVALHEPWRPLAVATTVVVNDHPAAPGARHNIWDMYHPQCPEPEKPIAPLRLLGPFGGPGAALGER